MRPARLRYKLWHIMLATAILGGLFAICGVIAGIGVLIAISAVVLPIVMVSPSRRLSVAAWVGTFYPVLLVTCLSATWFAAWSVLGHRPRLSLDDPKHISPIVSMPFVSTLTLFVGLFPFAPLLTVYLVIVQAVVSVRYEGLEPSKAAVRLLLSLVLWLSLLAVASCDISGWFLAGLFGE